MSPVLADALDDAHDAADAVLTDRTGLAVRALLLYAVATDGPFDYVQSVTPTVPDLTPATAANLAARLRDTANSIDPTAPARPNISAACDVVNARAGALGLEPGANPAVDYRPVLAGTDVDVDDLTARSVQYANQVAHDLAALGASEDDVDDVEEAARDFVGILASFWRHACTVGVIAGQESRR